MKLEPALIAPVAAWAQQAHPQFQPNGNGPGRRYGLLDGFSTLPKEIGIIELALRENYRIRQSAPVAPFRHFCGYQVTGAFVHRHRDEPANHVRFNVLVSKPLGGGEPVIDGARLEIPEGGAWRCDAGRHFHESTPVMGARPRIVLSFGFLL